MTTATAISPPLPRTATAERWIYFFTASLFAVVALVGFAPRSIEIITGLRRNPPLVVHVHAAVMAAWLALLFFQTLLVAVNRRGMHRTLGMASLIVGPALIASMIAVTIWRFGERISLEQTTAGANTLLNQGRAIVYFAVFFAWAVIVRRSDPETHKRMMLLATLGPFTAAIGRMTWLPTTMPESPLSVHLFMFSLLIPVVACDIYQRGRPHVAWTLGLALMLPWVIATHWLWGTPGWTATAMRLMGY